MKVVRRVGAGVRTGLMVAGVGAIAVVGLGVSGFSLPSPFQTTEQERPAAVLLTELRDQSEYVAAEARFSTVVDVEEDADYLPDFLKGEKTTFIAEGDVEATVDFSQLTTKGIEVGPDGSVTVTLPEPVLSEVRIDNDATYVADRDRGALDRLEDAVTGGNPTDDQALYQRADEKLADAAADSELRVRAQENTETFVTGLVEAMGYEDVTVVFETPEGETAA
jgi:hypothetical protein